MTFDAVAHIQTPHFHVPQANRRHSQPNPYNKRSNDASSLIILTDALKFEREKRACESSLVEFTRQAFKIVEPDVTFRSNWHIDAICDHLEAVSRGEINNLLINVPPGSMKSVLVSVMWPAWEWLHNPSLRFMGASYGEDLAVRDARKTRDIILDEWYQERWPHVQLVKGDDQKTKYSLTAKGWRMATSVGGRATGEHPDRKIVDDPHNAKQAQSDVERQNALDWYNQTLSTRGVSRGARTVCVMQRLHQRDASGMILDELKNYEHICLPMRYESAMRVKPTSIGFSDPRKEEGELLWPEMFPLPVVEQLEKSLGKMGTAGQLQQRPTPDGGGLLAVNNIRLWPHQAELPYFEYIVMSLDTAFTANTQNDPTACCVFGVFQHEGSMNVLLLDTWAEHLTYNDLKRRVMDDWKSHYGVDKRNPMIKGRRPDSILVENKGSGITLLQDMRQSNIPAIPYNPGRADKIQRANVAAPFVENGVIWVMESKKEPGKPISWARSAIKEWELFPVAEHDDQVDALVQAVIFLKDSNYLDMPVHEEDERDRYADDTRPRVNPYAQ